MKIEKLEKLSCLKIDDLQRPYILKSLEGVMAMLHEVEELETPSISEIKYEKPQFRDAIAVVPHKTSLHLEDGLFLAPKVIKKD
jgi:Asp-tRNA(Asn)/Glu-tRNA(Gln) amidotransferase C subunit